MSWLVSDLQAGELVLGAGGIFRGPPKSHPMARMAAMITAPSNLVPLTPTRKQAKRQHELEQVSRELDEIMGSK